MQSLLMFQNLDCSKTGKIVVKVVEVVVDLAVCDVTWSSLAINAVISVISKPQLYQDNQIPKFLKRCY